MPIMIVLDSSILVAALRTEENKHAACRNLLEKVKNGLLIAVEPYSVLIEVSAAIRRRTNSEELAQRVRIDLKNMGSIHFFEITERRAEEAATLAIKTGVRGMDAIVMQLASEMDAPLVTLDGELENKAIGMVPTKNLDEL